MSPAQRLSAETEAIQKRKILDYFVAYAPRNDEQESVKVKQRNEQSKREIKHGARRQADDGSRERCGAEDHAGPGAREDRQGQYAAFGHSRRHRSAGERQGRRCRSRLARPAGISRPPTTRIFRKTRPS